MSKSKPKLYERETIQFITSEPIYLDAIRYVGATDKRDKNTIGKYGSGLKMAIAGLLRCGQKVELSTVQNMGEFITKKVKISDGNFARAVILKWKGDLKWKGEMFEDERMGFTDYFGAVSWGKGLQCVLKCLRELHANTVDLNGEVQNGTELGGPIPMEKLPVPVEKSKVRSKDRTIFKVTLSPSMGENIKSLDPFDWNWESLLFPDMDEDTRKTSHGFTHQQNHTAVYDRGVFLKKLEGRYTRSYNLPGLLDGEDRRIPGEKEIQDRIREVLVSEEVDLAIPYYDTVPKYLFVDRKFKKQSREWEILFSGPIFQFADMENENTNTLQPTIPELLYTYIKLKKFKIISPIARSGIHRDEEDEEDEKDLGILHLTENEYERLTGKPYHTEGEPEECEETTKKGHEFIRKIGEYAAGPSPTVFTYPEQYKCVFVKSLQSGMAMEVSGDVGDGMYSYRISGEYLKRGCLQMIIHNIVETAHPTRESMDMLLRMCEDLTDAHPPVHTIDGGKKGAKEKTQVVSDADGAADEREEDTETDSKTNSPQG